MAAAATLSPGIYNIVDSSGKLALVSAPSGQTLVPTTNLVGTASSQQWLVTGDGVITPMDVTNGTKTCITLAIPTTPAANQGVILSSITDTSTKWIICGVSYFASSTPPCSTAYIMTHDINNNLFYWGLNSNQNLILQSTLAASNTWTFYPVLKNSS